MHNDTGAGSVYSGAEGDTWLCRRRRVVHAFGVFALGLVYPLVPAPAESIVPTYLDELLYLERVYDEDARGDGLCDYLVARGQRLHLVEVCNEDFVPDCGNATSFTLGFGGACESDLNNVGGPTDG